MNRQVAIAALLSVLVGFAGTKVSAAGLLDLYGLLITTAGIVFGVSGAWVALVHQAELRSDAPSTDRFEILVRSMTASGVIVAVVLVVTAALTTIPTLPWWSALVATTEGTRVRAIAKGILVCGWTFLALVQIWCMLTMLPSARFAGNELLWKRHRKEVLDQHAPGHDASTQLKRVEGED